jgi:ribonuclease P protein component
VTLVYVDPLAPGPEVARVAYAVGRKVGGAVVRNRVRRRLRAAMADLARTSPDLVPAGAYLVSAAPEAASLSFDQLAASLHGAARRLKGRRSPGQSGLPPSAGSR